MFLDMHPVCHTFFDDMAADVMLIPQSVALLGSSTYGLTGLECQQRPQNSETPPNNWGSLYGPEKIANFGARSTSQFPD